ncbi:hypothetical protein C8J56DRAFT_1165510 [Mycena floridula]|nr:hypothetical protein C8J56DRAFT_1165510 [Mycena floridula]
MEKEFGEAAKQLLHPPRIYMPFWSAFIAASLAVGTFAVAFVVEANIEYRAQCSPHVFHP